MGWFQGELREERSRVRTRAFSSFPPPTRRSSRSPQDSPRPPPHTHAALSIRAHLTAPSFLHVLRLPIKLPIRTGIAPYPPSAPPRAKKDAAEPMYSLRKRTRPAEKERAHKKEDDVSSLSSLSDSDVSEHDPAAHSVEESEDNFEAEEEGSKANYKKKTAAKKAPVKRTLSAPVDTNRQAVPVQGSSRSKPARAFSLARWRGTGKEVADSVPLLQGNAPTRVAHPTPALQHVPTFTFALLPSTVLSPLRRLHASPTSTSASLNSSRARASRLVEVSRGFVSSARVQWLISSARVDEALQSASQVAVEKSIGSLPSAVHRSALCLIMKYVLRSIRCYPR